MRMHGRKMLDALKEAGIIRDGDYVHRVVIDITIDKAVIMYVERYGDTRLLDLTHALDGAVATVEFAVACDTFTGS